MTFSCLSVCIFFSQTRSSYPISDHLPLESDENNWPLSLQNAFTHNFRWFTNSWNPHGPLLGLWPTGQEPLHTVLHLSHRKKPLMISGTQVPVWTRSDILSWVNKWDIKLDPTHPVSKSGWPASAWILQYQEAHCIQRPPIRLLQSFHLSSRTV